MKRFLLLLPLLLFAGVIAAFGLGLTRDPSQIPSQLIDRPLPAFSLPPLLADTPGLSNTALTGEPKLLNVFASWCAACPQEHPVLTRIAREGVPIYGIDWKDTPADGSAWLAKFGNPFGRVGSDPAGRTGIDLGVTGVPETFVVDAAGRVRYKHIGPISPEDWEQKIKPMLAELRKTA